jgi:hypothetical protein
MAPRSLVHLGVPRDRAGTTIRLALEWDGPLSGVLRLLLGRRALAYVTTEAEALETTAATRRADA